MKVTVELEEGELSSLRMAVETARQLQTEVMNRYPVVKLMSSSIPAFAAFKNALDEYDRIRRQGTSA